MLIGNYPASEGAKDANMLMVSEQLAEIRDHLDKLQEYIDLYTNRSRKNE